MGRLGTFNRRLNPPSHPEDRQRPYEQAPASEPMATLGYTLGINRNESPYETPLSSGTGPGQQPRRRMAMDILNITDSPGTPKYLPLPNVGGAEMRVPGIMQP